MKSKTLSGSIRRWLEHRFHCEIVSNWRLERHELAKHLKEVFSSTGVEKVIDVGANKGQYHDFLRLEVGFEGPIYSFEPVRELSQLLERRATEHPNWFIQHCALGKSAGTISINVMENDQFTSVLAPKKTGLTDYDFKNSVKEVQNVPVMRLDAFIAREAGLKDCRRIYLKIDTQGFDLEVLGGVGAALEQVVALQSEVSLLPLYEGMPDYKTSIAAYNEQGFEISGLFPIARDQFLRVVELDCVMVNPSCVTPIDAIGSSVSSAK